MQKLLYFVCPTDCMEPIINNRFKQKNCYLSSLGNSIAFDDNVLGQVRKLIITNNIREISFVLSNDNRIFLDALGNQYFSNIIGLDTFYNKIIRNKEYSEVLWRTWNRQLLILSYHLNDKMKELKLGLNGSFLDDFKIKISGKIYDRQENTFNDIYPDLICIESFNLN